MQPKETVTTPCKHDHIPNAETLAAFKEVDERGGTKMKQDSKATKELAEKALIYIEFHSTEYGVGFSFDADKYAKEVLTPAIKRLKK